jgi:hypothetical protein
MTNPLKLSARPNINGNTRRDFADAYKAIADARRAMQAAAAKVLGDVANGRNYQHLANADAAVIADRRRLQEDFAAAAALLGVIGSAIADTCDAHDREAA